MLAGTTLLKELNGEQNENTLWGKTVKVKTTCKQLQDDGERNEKIFAKNT